MNNLVRDSKPIQIRITGKKDLVLEIEKLFFEELNFYNDSPLYIDSANNYTKYLKLKNTEKGEKHKETKTLKSQNEMRVIITCTHRELHDITDIINKKLDMQFISTYPKKRLYYKSFLFLY